MLTDEVAATAAVLALIGWVVVGAGLVLHEPWEKEPGSTADRVLTMLAGLSFALTVVAVVFGFIALMVVVWR